MVKIFNSKNADYNRYAILRTPAGSGDIHWILCRFARLRHLMGKEVGITVAAKNEVKRSHDFLSMIPDIEFMGYDEEYSSFQCMAQCIPLHPMNNGKMAFFAQPWAMNISANFHLEAGIPLSKWFPHLPLDYHYKINIPKNYEDEGNRIAANMPKPLFGVYVSGDRKDRRPGWEVLSTEEWIWFLKEVHNLTKCSFVFVGMQYDADRTLAVSHALSSSGIKTHNIIDKHLGVVLQVFKNCSFTLQFPGGIGMLCDNLNIPVLMFLPHILRPMENAEIFDPMNIAYNNSHLITAPTPKGALEWFQRVGMPANDIKEYR